MKKLMKVLVDYAEESAVKCSVFIGGAILAVIWSIVALINFWGYIFPDSPGWASLFCISSLIAIYAPIVGVFIQVLDE